MTLFDLTNLSAALSDPTRVRILASLLGGRDEELCVCEVTDLFDLAPSTVSKHLLILRQAGLVEGRKQGRWMYYRPAREPSGAVAESLRWIRMAAATDPRLRADASRLRELIAAGEACCGDESASCCPSGDGTKMKNKLRVLFLCTGNSCRSQMAEGWARALKGDEIEAFSAGTKPHGLNPLAVRVMREAGVDLSGQSSKHIDDVLKGGQKLDVVVTVCDSAHESCPVLPGATRVVHVGFDDPPRLAAGATSDDEALPHYRRVRDEIRTFVEGLPESLRASAADSKAAVPARS